ncbi:MAG: P-loop NTPase [Planctomycetota bacterium]
MPDQATILRGLMERHAQPQARQEHLTPRTGTRCLAITSGKGGVGKSHIALNLAIQLSQTGRSVCVLDANPGPGNLELMCGLNGYWNLKHVASGARQVADVALEGPQGIRLLSGAAELLDSPFRAPTASQMHVWQQVSEFLNQHQYVVIDTASGDQPLTRRLMQAADCTWLVTTPELTAIADAYSLVKSCAAQGPLPQIEVLVNRSESAVQAREIIERMQQTSRNFLQQEIYSAGYLPQDACVASALVQRQPFVLASPRSAAAQAIGQLATQWAQRTAESQSSFTHRIGQQSRRAA